MKRIRRWTLITLVVTLALCQPLFAQGSGEDKRQGLGAAETWLKLVDKGAFGLSWAGAGKVFKSSVSQGHWDNLAAAVRTPLGPVVRRKLSEHKFLTRLDGMPDGLYLMLRYQTEFEKKAAAVETLTLAKEDDGFFRVIGYFIK